MSTSRLGRVQFATLLWVCEDCLLAHEGYDEHELGRSFEREPLNLIPNDVEATTGMLQEEHEGEDCGPDVECSCEEVSFSWRSCEGCGSPLGGTRHALTIWTDAR